MLHGKRMIGLDFFRIMAAFVVFLFHSTIHIGCNYGIIQNFIRMGAVFMTGFFMLSGFVLFKTNSEKNLSEITEIKRFYSKRFFAIFPVYYITAIIFILILDHENLKLNLFLAPVEILGIQSTFSSLFGISHNGGTWFISCLLISSAWFEIVYFDTNECGRDTYFNDEHPSKALNPIDVTEGGMNTCFKEEQPLKVYL